MVLILKKAKNALKAALISLDSQEPQLEINHKILVATHHKTGTVWLLTIFKEICRQFNLGFFSGKQENISENFDVFLSMHGRLNLDTIGSEYYGIHIIRDPRDIIISGCFYHTKSKEKWLHIKRDEFGGLTYQEKINSYESLEDKILFEMENSALRNISKILNWDYNNPKFIEIKYENLINDQQLLLFHEIFAFLGFSGKVIPQLLEIAYNKSLFSGNLTKSLHLRSGKTNQWKEYFQPIHKAKFMELYGDILIDLGYENDDSWLNT